MNKDDITRMAREAGFVGFDGDNRSLCRFASLVAEDCAKIAEKAEPYQCADLIRARFKND